MFTLPLRHAADTFSFYYATPPRLLLMFLPLALIIATP